MSLIRPAEDYGRSWPAWLVFFLLCALALSAFDLSKAGAFGRSLQDVLGPGNARIAAAALIAALVVANVWLIGRFSFGAQVAIVWAELLFLFLLFFHSFSLNYGFILQRLPSLLGFTLQNGFLIGAALTIFICVVSITASTLLALIAALARLSGNGAAFGAATFYVSFFRGTPLLLQVFLIYLGLPQLGVVLDAIPAGIIALSLCYGAYMAEIFRAGILAVPLGQSEAARSLGLRGGPIMRLVVMPQAMRLIIPPTGNQFIAMLKDSSLVSTMGAWELMYLARTYGRADFKYMEMLIAAALIYWALSAAFELIQARIEKRFGKGVAI